MNSPHMARFLSGSVAKMLLALLLTGVAGAQEPPALPDSLANMDPLKAGQLLAERLRVTAPSEPSSYKGALKVRRSGQTVSIPVQFIVQPQNTGWEAIYETAAVGQLPAEKVIIVHKPQAATQYLYTRGNAAPVPLTNGQATISLANSDFWLTDLGMEFGHWPMQRFIKGEMRLSRFCYVLESTNPEKTGSGYSRVLSWIDKESGGILIAEGYDRQGKPLKQFEVRSIKKVQGQWQVQEIEMQNLQARSRTRLEFNYGK